MAVFLSQQCDLRELAFFPNFLRRYSLYLNVAWEGALILSVALFLAGVLSIPSWRFIRRKIAFTLRGIPYYFIRGPLIIAYSDSIHGMESVFVEEKVVKHSKGGRFLLIYGTAFTVAIALLKLHSDFASGLLGIPYLPHPISSRTVNMILLALSQTIVYFHYLLDAVVYRMRNPANREIIAPLLR